MKFDFCFSFHCNISSKRALGSLGENGQVGEFDLLEKKLICPEVALTMWLGKLN